MNFNFFNELYSHTDFDDIKVIGKEIQKDGRFYHIAGMSLKEKKVTIYILEFDNHPLQEETFREKTPREQLKSSMDSPTNTSFFMHIREFQSKDKVYETSGANSGPIMHGDFCEAYILFMKMRQAGWEISEESLFYEAQWDGLALTKIELRDEYESLPQWNDDMQVLVDTIPENSAIELPVRLESGKTMEMNFSLKDGSPAVCYINKVYTIDVWADGEKKFADSEYRERMLQHMTEDEFEHIKEHFFEILSEHCPKGKHYMVIEYECSKDLSLTFYDKEYLDTIEKPKKGSASSILMRVKPDVETGAHGLKMRGCVIQKPLDEDVKVVDGELFSYSELIQKRVEKLS